MAASSALLMCSICCSYVAKLICILLLHNPMFIRLANSMYICIIMAFTMIIGLWLVMSFFIESSQLYVIDYT